MRMSEAFPTKYLSAGDLQGREVPVTISHIVMEDIERGEMKPVVYFQGKQKGLVLNKTNANMISMIFGDETDAWPGAALILYVIQTEYQGKPVQGLRVKVAQQAPQQANSGVVPATQMPTGMPQPAPVGDGLPELDDGADIPF